MDVYTHGSIVEYRPTMDIRNLQSIPRGTGCRYLECIRAHTPGVLIAAQWRRTAPASFDVLVDLGVR